MTAGVRKRTAEHKQPSFFCSSLPLALHFKTFVKHIIRDDNNAEWNGIGKRCAVNRDFDFNAL